eukprot:scaffold4.g4872.t1
MRTVAGVCRWWRCVALEGPGLLGSLNLNRIPLFGQRARSQPNFFEQRMGFMTWLLLRAHQVTDLTLTADRGLEESSDQIKLRLAISELTGPRLRRLKAIACDNGRVITAFLGAATRLQELVIVDSDWDQLPAELLRLPLTRLHLRYADLEAPGWLPALPGPDGGAAAAAAAGPRPGSRSSDRDRSRTPSPQAASGGKGAGTTGPVRLPSTLVDLTLEGCQIREVPEQLAELSALTSLALDRNYLRAGSLPNALSRLRGLRRVSLEGCSTLGELPSGLAALPLQELRLLHGGVRGLPPGAPCLVSLTRLAWGVADAAPAALDLAALTGAHHLRWLQLDNLPSEQESEVVALQAALAASLEHLRVNSAVLLG